MRLSVGLLAAPLAAGACAGPRPPNPGAAVETVTVTLPPPAPPPPTVSGPPPPAIELPASPTCVLHGDPIVAPSPVALRLRPGGPPFAFVRPARGDMHFFRIDGGTRADLYVVAVDIDVRRAAADATVPTLHVRALAASEDVAVYAQRHLTVGEGIVTPKPAAPLAVQAVAPTTLVVRLDQPALRVVTVHNANLTRETSCRDIGLAPLAGPPPAGWAMLDAHPIGTAGLSRPGPLQIAFDVDGKAGESSVVQMDLPPETPLVVLENRGTRTRVRCELPDSWVIGWVDRSALAIPFAPSGADWPVPVGPSAPPAPVAPDVVRCDHDVPIEARFEGDERTVGSAPAGTPIGVVSSDGARSSVSFASADLVVAPGAELRVVSATLQGCRRAGAR